MQNNDYSGGWTGKSGVNSKSDFLNNEIAQEEAIREYTYLQWQTIKNWGLDKYVGTTINGILITQSGMLAGAHLVGVGDLRDFLQSNGSIIPADGNHVPITDYLNQFGGYPTPFDSPLTPFPEIPPSAWVPAVQQPVGGAEGSSPGGGNNCPLVLDLGTGGVTLSAVNGTGSVYWDIDQDGFREASGWVTGNSALLAIDKNANGTIDDNGELFGNTATYANGFANLAQYDSNSDGHITSADAQYGNLIVWTDDNHDGVSAVAEMHTLASLQITDINLGFATVNYAINGNDVKQQSTFTMNGVTHTIVDAWFAYDNINSEYAGSYTLDVRTLFLPDLRGYGTLKDLHIAMSQDTTLLTMVQTVASATAANVLSPAFDLKGKMTDILYKWAGVDTVDPASRGGLFDARSLGFLEKFLGTPYVQNGSGSDPHAGAVSLLDEAWQNALGTLAMRVALQGPLHSFFPGVTAYDPLTDTFANNSWANTASLVFANQGTQTLINSDLTDVYFFAAGDSPASTTGDNIPVDATGGVDKILLSSSLPSDVRMWVDYYGTLNIQYSATDIIRVAGARDSLTGASLIASHISSISYADGTYNDLTTGLNLIDTNDGHQMIGSALADNIDGRDGNDYIYTYGGNDTLTGGVGYDVLTGGTGDDTYVFNVGDGAAASGGDAIQENVGEGTDTIRFGAGILSTDVHLITGQFGAASIYYSATDLVTFSGGYNATNGASEIYNNIEHIAFADGTVWDLTQGLVINGTSNADYVIASNLADTISGNAGSDYLYGYGGNDALTGGVGYDVLTGGTGDDTYVFNLGDSAAVSGGDVIQENVGEGTDTIRFGAGILHTDVHLVTGQLGQASVYFSATDLITFSGGYNATNGASEIYNNIERIAFADGTVWDLTKGLIINGTVNADYIYASNLADTINSDNGNDYVYAFDGNDFINGGAGSDNLYGGNGNDTIDGGTGDDALYGEAGTDTASYASSTAGVVVSLAVTAQQNTVGAGLDTLSGFENLTGSGFNDTLTGDANANIIYGDNGNDLIDGGAGDDILAGGAGTDTLTYASAASAISLSLAVKGIQATGGAGNDMVFGFENVTGSAFNDTLTGDSGANTIDGGNGNDTIEGGAGNDTLIGGAGTDTVTYANAASAVVVSLANASAQNTGGAGTDTLSGFENLTGSAFNDTLSGDANANTIDGGAGDDVIDGGAGNDTLTGGAGTDTLTYVSASAGITINLATTTAQATGGSGSDTISGFENLTGSAFNDTLTGDGNANVIEGGVGNDTLNGGAGIDTVSYRTASAGVTVNLATTTAQNTVGAGTDTITAFENILGSAFNDTLTGDGNANVIDGGAGNDTMNGGAGTDTLSYASATGGVTISLALTSAQNTGGAGADTVSAFENLTGSAFNDTLTGDGNANVIDGGAGNDTMNGGAGTDTATYASASSGVTVSLAITTAQNTIGAGTDTLTAFENLTGSAFDDVLTGDGNANVIDGGAGNDTINGGAGNDTLIGGVGTDTLSYSGATAAITINLATTTAQATGGSGSDTISGFENLIGSSFNDTLTGDGNANVIEGGAGNDTMNGGAGIDTVSYASATSAVTVSLATTTAQNTVGAGTDTITAFENILGSAFNDTLTGDGNANVIDGGAGNDTMNGGAGTDTVSYASAASAVAVSLALTTAQNTVGAGTDTITGFENLTGSSYHDTLTGDGNANVIDGGAGNDTIDGGAGNDTLIGGIGIDTLSYATATAGITINLATTTAQATGGSGSDTISAFENLTGSAFNDTLTGDDNANVIDGGAGNDIMNGGAGTDTLSYASASSGVTVDLSVATAQNTVGAGTDTISGFENLTGSAFNDTLTGDGNANVLTGGAGNDTLYGGSGNDWLYGGSGADALYGGSGADHFVFEPASAFSNVDTIKDFSIAEGDQLDISQLLTGFDPVASAITDFVQITDNGGNSIVSVDRDGTGTAYGFVQIATIEGVTGLTDELTLYNSAKLLAA